MWKFLAGLVLALAILGTARAEELPLDPQGLVDPALLGAAIQAQSDNWDRVAVRDRMIVVDYGLRSDAPRLFVVDLSSGEVTAYRAAHGRGSDRNHDGWLEHFSSVAGSSASPSGSFVTAEIYTGQHGPSVRLDGLEESNANARERLIVIHAAWYAEPGFLAEHGKLGRSFGCIVLSEADRDALYSVLEPGTFLYVGKSARQD